MAQAKSKKTTMEDFVYAKLKSAIYKRYIRPGSQLVEASIAEQLGVSRTPVRGAIKKLVYEGFVQVVANKGAFVLKPTLQEIKEAFLVRTQLEKTSAYLAAQHIKPAQIKKLYSLIEEEKAIFAKRDLSNYYKMNDSFHFTIAKSAENNILLQYVQDIVSRTNVYLILFDPFYQMEINLSCDEHIRITKALENRDAGGAEEAMAKHLSSALHEMKLEESTQPDDYLFL